MAGDSTGRKDRRYWVDAGAAQALVALLAHRYGGVRGLARRLAEQGVTRPMKHSKLSLLQRGLSGPQLEAASVEGLWSAVNDDTETMFFGLAFSPGHQVTVPAQISDRLQGLLKGRRPNLATTERARRRVREMIRRVANETSPKLPRSFDVSVAPTTGPRIPARARSETVRAEAGILKAMANRWGACPRLRRSG